LLASRILFVLSAFFIVAAVAALTWIKAAALAGLPVLLAALARFLTTLFAAFVAALTSRAIILRIPARRLLSALTSTLFRPLLSLSVVCHIDSSLGMFA
jgi:fructose-specific phosphotransferase system IIC component